MNTTLLSRIMGIKHLYVYILVYIFTYLPIILYPFDTDHWIYIYIGKRFWEGDKLYTQLFDSNSPTLYLINGIISSITLNIWNTRFILIIFSILSIIAFYKLTKIAVIYFKLNDVEASNFTIISILFFIFFINLSFIYGSGNSPDVYGFTILLWSIYWYFVNKYQRILFYDLLIGVSWGILITLKPIWLLFGAILLIDYIISFRGKEVKFKLQNTFLFLLGFIILPSFWIYYLFINNSFSDFYLATIQYNFSYLWAAWKGEVTSAWRVLFQALIVFLIPVLIYFWQGYKKLFDVNMSSNNFLRVWFGIAFVSSILWFVSGTFFSIYLLPLLPAFSIIISFWLYDSDYSVKEKKDRYLFYGLVVSVFLCLFMSVYQIFGFSLNSNDKFSNLRLASDYIKNNTGIYDSSAVYGYGSTFYTLAERKSASKFVNSSDVFLDYKADLNYNFSKVWVDEINNNKVKYILTTPDYQNSYSKNDIIKKYLENTYEVQKQFGEYKIWVRK